MKLSKEARKYLEDIRSHNGDLHSEWVIHAMKVKFNLTKADAIELIEGWEKEQPKLLTE